MSKTQPKQKKFWLIYLKDEDCPSKLTLYAWTDIKELYQRFTKERNMDMFRVKKYHYDPDLSFSLALNSQSEYLEILSGRTKDSKFNIVDTELVVTLSEKMLLMKEYSCFIYQTILGFVETPYEIFNDDIIEALDIIKYNSLFKLFGDDGKKSDEDAADFYGNIKMDLLSIFIHYYGKTLKGA